MKFEAVRATAVDRVRGIEVIQPCLEQGATPGEVEMHYSVYFDNRVEAICCLATVDEKDDGSQSWTISLSSTGLIDSLKRIQRALGDSSGGIDFLLNIADAMTLVYASGYDIYETTLFTVVANADHLAEHNMTPPVGSVDESGNVILSRRLVNVSFEAEPVSPTLQPEPDPKHPPLAQKVGEPESVFASGRASDGASNLQRAFDFIASYDGNAGTLFHTPFGRAINNARSSDEFTIVAGKFQTFLREEGIRPFLGKYRNAAVDFLMNAGYQDFTKRAVEMGSCIAFVDGYLPHSRFAQADLPILRSAPGLRVFSPSLTDV